MQPLQYDLRCPDAAAQSNLDAAITVRSAGAELQSAIELRATAPEIAAPKPDLGAKAKITDFEALCKGIVKGKYPVSKLRKFADQSLYRSLDAATPICFDVQLQKTIVLRTQPWHQATLTQPSQCDLQGPSCKAQ